MNRIDQKLAQSSNVLSIYFTAGFPNLNDTVPTLINLEKSGVDLIEIGLPFSDPLADGPTIQASSTQALANGMSTQVLFDQLENIRASVQVPLIIMGYINPVLQYGVERFLQACQRIGIDGLILPDLPLEIYTSQYQELFEQYNIHLIQLITPQTSEARINAIDQVSKGFIYMVSTAATTGNTGVFSDEQQEYFKRIAAMNLKNKQLIGFGIHNKETFDCATNYQSGGIIGSDFVRYVSEHGIDHLEKYTKKYR
ncbi:MAG: tryptophan synthase subunit alpha [Flavobacterium sp.]|nr:tryptophan synthase subunit alpha [Candidatus Neoflavobacterium equi]